MNNQKLYINEKIFEELVENRSINGVIDQQNSRKAANEVGNESGIKFICEAPVGSGKSTAIQKFIKNQITKQELNITDKYYKFIVIVPTVNIAEQFANNIFIDSEKFVNEFSADAKNVNENQLKNTFSNEKCGINPSESGINPSESGINPSESGINPIIYTKNIRSFVPCIGDGAFKMFNEQMKDANNIEEPVIITTYSTAVKCLGTLVEYFFRHKKQDKIDECFLIIDEAHLLLEYTALIETIRDFKNVGLLSATPDNIKNLKVFGDYTYIKPKSSVIYDRTIYIHEIENKTENILNQIASKVDELLLHEEKGICLVKIEDKSLCNKLKEKLNYKYNVYLYNSDTKEVIINEQGKFSINNENKSQNIQIVITTSCIQAGQSLKDENLISLFVQTPIDIDSNIKQFIGRNRNPTSETHLYLRINKDNPDSIYAASGKKFKFEYGNGRYKTVFNKLKSRAWNYNTIDDWRSKLKDYGKIVIDEQQNCPALCGDNEISNIKENPINTEIAERVNYDDGKEFSTKKALYKHYNIKSLKYIPCGYKIAQRWVNKNNERTRKYKLCKT